MTGENGFPETPEWQLPRPVASEDLTIPASIVLGEN